MNDEHEGAYWLIHFEDADIDVEIFTSEESARKRYEMCQVAWSCQLFKCQPPIEKLTVRQVEDWITGLLADAWNAQCNLPEIHPADKEEFCLAIHAAQNIILARQRKQEGL